MNIVLISSVLGFAACVLQAAALKESLGVSVSVRPPGPNIYLGEDVLLQCMVEPHSTSVRSYRWHRSTQPTAENPRHVVSGNSYFITAVTREDVDSYSCQAQCLVNKTNLMVEAQLTLNVSELSPPSLFLTPNTKQMLSGERFSLQCPISTTNSSGWRLVRVSPDRPTVYNVNHSPPGGGVSADKGKAQNVFVAASGNSGLYWCEGTESRSNAINITVSYGNISLKTPAFPVFAGDDVVLNCQYRRGKKFNTTFFKNRSEIDTYSSYGAMTLTIRNVTQEDEGFYKCATHDRKMESLESWLSVRPERGKIISREGTPASNSGSWKWISVSCGVALLLIPLIVWLVCHYRYQKVCTRGCWPFSKQDIPAEPLPATKHDVTEVQWDLSWMEMSNLLDKKLYPST